MGRRGHPKGFHLGDHSVECSHTGFEIWRKGLVHSRSIQLGEDGFEIKDGIRDLEPIVLKPFFISPLAIDIKRGRGLSGGKTSLLRTLGGTQLKESQYYPEFGLVQDRPCLVLEGRFSGNGVFGLRCIYSS